MCGSILYFSVFFLFFFFFKQKTAYEMRISDWSSDVCSSDLAALVSVGHQLLHLRLRDAADALHAVDVRVHRPTAACQRGLPRGGAMDRIPMAVRGVDAGHDPGDRDRKSVV